jgi:hypothetical protein
VRPPIGRVVGDCSMAGRAFGEVIDLQTPRRSDSLDSQAARCGRPLATTASRGQGAGASACTACTSAASLPASEWPSPWQACCCQKAAQIGWVVLPACQRRRRPTVPGALPVLCAGGVCNIGSRSQRLGGWRGEGNGCQWLMPLDITLPLPSVLSLPSPASIHSDCTLTSVLDSIGFRIPLSVVVPEHLVASPSRHLQVAHGGHENRRPVGIRAFPAAPRQAVKEIGRLFKRRISWE